MKISNNNDYKTTIEELKYTIEFNKSMKELKEKMGRKTRLNIKKNLLKKW